MLIFYNLQYQNHNFIAISSNKSHKYLIKKIDAKLHSMKIDHNQYSHCISNSEIPSNFINILGKKTYQQTNLNEIVKFNLKKILSLPIKSIVEPIYISENKLFD